MHIKIMICKKEKGGTTKHKVKELVASYLNFTTVQIQLRKILSMNIYIIFLNKFQGSTVLYNLTTNWESH